MTREISKIQSDIEAEFRDAYNRHQSELHDAVQEHANGDPIELVSSVLAVALTISWEVTKTQTVPGARADHAAIMFQHLAAMVGKAIIETDLSRGQPVRN